MEIVTVCPGLPARNVPDSDQLTLTVSAAAGAGSALTLNDTALPSLTVGRVAVIVTSGVSSVGHRHRR